MHQLISPRTVIWFLAVLGPALRSVAFHSQPSISLLCRRPCVFRMCIGLASLGFLEKINLADWVVDKAMPLADLAGLYSHMHWT